MLCYLLTYNLSLSLIFLQKYLYGFSILLIEKSSKIFIWIMIIIGPDLDWVSINEIYSKCVGWLVGV